MLHQRAEMMGYASPLSLVQIPNTRVGGAIYFCRHFIGRCVTEAKPCVKHPLRRAQQILESISECIYSSYISVIILFAGKRDNQHQ